jgi:AcrR family transcriptional regulator
MSTNERKRSSGSARGSSNSTGRTARSSKERGSGTKDTDESGSSKRIGRPPKVDEHGTPTRDRLLKAAIAVCVEDGYEGATLSEIARRAHVSTPAVYSHFEGKADLLATASRVELEQIGGRLPQGGGLRAIARYWLSPEFASTRTLITELHNASRRHPEMAKLMQAWHTDNSSQLRVASGLRKPEEKMYYLLLLGLSHLDALASMGVSQEQIEDEAVKLLEGWLAYRYE